MAVVVDGSIVETVEVAVPSAVIAVLAWLIDSSFCIWFRPLAVVVAVSVFVVALPVDLNMTL